jgi:hypothetical protein
MSIRGDILNALQDALLEISTANGYANNIGTVERRAFGKNDKDRSQSPMIFILDSGYDIPSGVVGVNQRSKMSVTLNGLVKHESISPDAADMSDRFNTFLADVRRCLNSANLGAQVSYCRPGEVRALTDNDEIAFDQDIEILYYYDSGASADTPTAPAIYGDNTILDDIRAELYAQMNGLKTAMAAISPRPLSVYNSHEQITMTLPAITVGVNDISPVPQTLGRQAGSGALFNYTYRVGCQIRVHTDYQGGAINEIESSRLINSIINWLSCHDSLNINSTPGGAIEGLLYFTLDTANTRKEFEESLTVGGELNMTIILNLDHVQA